ncbi:MAG: hypothetical protein H6807_01065 [Planctomycetes bacterium]|nr:hypothetical protein [Planctomycetota bacterium]
MNERARILALIDEVYRDLPGGGEADAADRALVEERAGATAATYGEILPSAAAELFDWLRPGAGDLFVDVGSGVGRLALQALLTTRVGRVVAVELSPFRHEVACRAREVLRRLLPEAADRLDRDLDLRLGDLRDQLPTEVSLVWAGSICFPDGLMISLARALLAAPRFRRLVTLKSMPPAVERQLSTLGVLDLDMSWAPRVRATVYGPPRRVC